ncbi:MAG: TonB-dependent receptor [Deltaproteobacteria bacterium]|nr:TonB-dependent receptor [Deltaproteobacteria bacterium]
MTPWRWDDVRAVKLRFSAGRAIRYPSLRELYQPPAFQLGYFLAGSRALSAEKAWALRASVESNPVRWLSTTVTGFYSETTDYIRPAYQGRQIQTGEGEPIPPNPVLCPILPAFCSEQPGEPLMSNVFENTNLDGLRSYGIEARLELRPHELIELQLGYTWNRSLIEDSNLEPVDDRLPNSPEHVANGAITLTAPRFGTTLTARGQWRDRAVIEPTGTGSISFATRDESNTSFELDMRLRQPLEQWLGHKLELFTDVQNVTDNRVIDSNVVRGRSFLIGLRGNFPDGHRRRSLHVPVPVPASPAAAGVGHALRHELRQRLCRRLRPPSAGGGRRGGHDRAPRRRGLGALLFVPSLPRGNHPTLYAFHGFDAPTSTVHDFETYLWFDVSQSDLPAGHVLVEATLVVTYAFDFTDFGEPSTDPGTLQCRKVTGAWSESSLTWVNRPTVAEPFDTITGITGFGAQLCDATGVVLEWIGNRAPNEGFALTNATDRVIGMHSREASASAALKPTLILRTEAPEPGLAAALAAGAAALAGSRRARPGARAARRADRSRRTAPSARGIDEDAPNRRPSDRRTRLRAGREDGTWSNDRSRRRRAPTRRRACAASARATSSGRAASFRSSTRARSTPCASPATID